MPGVLPSSSSSNQRLPRHAHGALGSSSSTPSSESGFEAEITSLCEAGQYGEAIAILEQLPPDARRKSSCARLLRSLSDRHSRLWEERINVRTNATPTARLAMNNDDDDDRTKQYLHWTDTILQTMLELGEQSDTDSSLLPTAEDIHLAIEMWASSTSIDGASVRCQSYLDTLWSLHEKRKDERFVPLRESYDCAVSACSARDRGLDAAERAENLLKEMGSVCREHPALTPDRSVANGVMNAWSNSGKKFKKGKKCEEVLEGMIDIALGKGNGERRPDMVPDTNSFNIVLNALAQGKERNSEIRAETLFERMESLSSSGSGSDEDGLAFDCQPDEISFNTVLNGWAMSWQKGAANRATTILDHMKKRHEAGLTEVQPDWSTYTTVLKAWARSRDPDAIHRAEDVFSEYQDACEDGESSICHNAFAYNSMINCYAKSKDPDAVKRAMELFETMKTNTGKPGWELCFVDIFTYTTLIDAISKQQSLEASETAISLMEEVEESFAKTGDVRFEPNIRLYTSVVNAIGRSHKFPDRAKAIVDRLESAQLGGSTKIDFRPDVVCYNALINAYGWSDAEERSRKSFEILKHMMSLYKSGRLPDAKPDTVSFNSVLNACAYETERGDGEGIMKIVVQVFELLNSSPEYGRPDQSTYVQVLASIAGHMDESDEKRTPMAEATFLQCASNGLVGPVVIPRLHAAVSRARFRQLMGPASKGRGDRLEFDVSELPPQWTANAMGRHPGKGRRSRSRRLQSNFQVTKNVLSSAKPNQTNRKRT